MHQEIDNITLLSETDKKILHEALEQFMRTQDFSHAKLMSIFSKEGETIKFGAYTAERYSAPVNYFSRTIFNPAPMFLDQDFKILPHSNGSFSLPYSFIERIDYYLDHIIKLKQNALKSSLWLTSIVATQTWFSSYGHLHDELYILEDFSKTHCRHSRCLLDYHLNNDFVKGIPYSMNYIEMDRMILSAPSVNMHLRPSIVAKISDLTLIRNTINDNCFHSFPLETSQRLIKNTNSTINQFYFERPETGRHTFISRKGGVRSHRLFANIVELENSLKSIGVSVVYPESLSFTEMIYLVSNASSLVLTWGSAITNLAYARPGSSVTILRSNSYKDEQISLFEKIIKSRNLDINIIDANNDDLIDLEEVTSSRSFI